jgi:hypothetical protein
LLFQPRKQISELPPDAKRDANHVPSQVFIHSEFRS